MKCYESMNLYEDLKSLVERDVNHYKTDLDIDMEIISKAYKEGIRSFIWMTRDAGTECQKETDVFLKNTPSNLTVEYYLTTNPCNAVYFLEVYEKEDGVLAGALYPLDKDALLDKVKGKSVAIGSVEISADEIEPVFVEYEAQDRSEQWKGREQLVLWNLSQKYGCEKFDIKYHPSEDDKYLHNAILTENKKERERAKNFDFSNLLKTSKEKLDGKIVSAEKKVKNENAVGKENKPVR